jgi:hypothetical protein
MSKKHSDKQIGGEHYKHMKIQPTEFVSANDIPFIEGNVIKYVCRHAHKNGKEDVLKAIHYLNLLIEYHYESNDVRDLYSKEAYHMPIAKALKRIKEGNSATKIEAIRNGAKEFKKTLPIVLFSGEFETRNDEALARHSQFIVLDFDHIDVASSKAILSTDPYVYSCWVSPSGDGLKALVKVSNPERHRDHFRALRTYFHKQYDLEVDESGINESRACFESYDPEIVINDDQQMYWGTCYREVRISGSCIKAGIYTDYLKLNRCTYDPSVR